MKPLEYLKALVGALLAGLGGLYLGLSDDVVTVQEWVGIVTVTLSTFAGVWGVPNAPRKDLVSKQTVTVESTQVNPSPAVSASTAEELANTARG